MVANRIIAGWSPRGNIIPVRSIKGWLAAAKPTGDSGRGIPTGVVCHCWVDFIVADGFKAGAPGEVSLAS